MAWQPESEALSQLARCLRDSLSGHDFAAQRSAEQAKGSPDINNYLVYLCITPSSTSNLPQEGQHAARSAAAIMLKNNVKTSFKSIPAESLSYLKSNILLGLRDPHNQIRNYVGSVITEIIRQGGVLGWPQVLPDLASLVANDDNRSSSEAQDGAMGAIFKICEDNKRALDQEYHTQRPLGFLLPKLLEFAGYTSNKVRSKALATINIFIGEPVALTARENMDAILTRIVQLSTDSDGDVRRYVCRSFALLADSLPEVLVPHAAGIVEYTLTQQSDVTNQELALDAAEFFFEASTNRKLRDALGPFLPKIVPTLLDCMVYSEDDQVRLEGDGDDADVEDEAKDIRPQFATSKAQQGVSSNTGETSNSTNGQAKSAANGYAYEDEELSDGEIDEEEDGDVDPEDEWNLRKCSAAALDSLASHFHGAVFKETLPWLIENLKHKDWPNREAAVLALGAIGPGCMDDIQPHLPELVPYLITLLNDEQPVVRQITCWALSRYAGWAAHLDANGKVQFFEPMMDGILKRMLDNNKKVQESASSAFAVLEEAAQQELAPYCHVILQQFVQCFGKYKDKNMYILYDCVQTLAEHGSPSLAQPENVNLLMPALIERWKRVGDQSREMFPLLECLSFVATALGPEFAPFAEPLFMRCIRLIRDNLEDGMAQASGGAGAGGDAPDKDFLVTSLDLLSSIIQSLDEPQSARLTASAQPNMFQLLAYCMKDPNNDVKQSAYALLGDCAIYIFAQLQPYLPALMEILIAQLDSAQGLTTGRAGDDGEPVPAPAPADEEAETAFRVVNNACWSCGEIAMRQKDGLAPFVDRVLEQLGAILFSPRVPESLNENAAIALGRLGIGNHASLSRHLATFAGPFLQTMRKVGWTDEKGHAYRGFVAVVLDNPQALEKCLLEFFAEMASAPEVFLTGMQDDGPFGGFERVLREYKRLIGEAQFDQYLGNLPQVQERQLRQLYSF